MANIRCQQKSQMIAASVAFVLDSTSTHTSGWSTAIIASGLQKILDPAETQEQMASRGMFWVPLFMWAAVMVELAGGLSILLGAKTWSGSLVLFLFLIPVTLTFHNFWTYPPEEQRDQTFANGNIGSSPPIPKSSTTTSSADRRV